VESYTGPAALATKNVAAVLTKLMTTWICT